MNDAVEVIKYKVRSQSNRKGPRSPLTEKQKAAILRKATNTNRKRVDRRAVGLASEAHAGRKAGESTIRRVLKTRGFKYFRSKATIALKPHHISCRLRWAKKWSSKPVSFWRKILFSDEKIFRMSEHRHRQNDGLWITADDPNPDDVAALEHVVDRHSIKICVWAGFAHCGKAGLCLFSENLTEKFYCQTIIKNCVLPFMAANESVEIFQQDGDPKHTADGTCAYLDEHLGDGNWTSPAPPPCKEVATDGTFVKVQKTSKRGTTRNYKIDSSVCHCSIPENYIHMAKSPDCNPMENAWTWMTRWMASRPVPKTEKAFHALIREAWRQMPEEYIRTLVDSKPRRFQAVVEAGGHMTKY
jgi:hypothetical protein